MRFFFLIVMFLMYSCNNNKNCSYKEALEKGVVKDYKTSFISINSNLNFKLDYVRDQLYKKKDAFCYGNIELGIKDFTQTITSITPKYKLENVFLITLFCSDKDICKGETMESQNIKGYSVYYLNEKKEMLLDYVNLITEENETYHVNGAHATVKMYFLMKRSGITINPSIIDIENFKIERKEALKIEQSEDKLYEKINEL